MSLTHRITFRNHHLAAALYRTAQIGLQLRNGHVAILVHGINLTILIEEHREVVDIAINFMMRPRSLGTIRNIHL
ncbi:unknown [Segatella copri CAG:164]|nr:unknown [Segatella copri CAG:164]